MRPKRSGRDGFHSIFNPSQGSLSALDKSTWLICLLLSPPQISTFTASFDPLYQKHSLTLYTTHESLGGDQKCCQVMIRTK